MAHVVDEVAKERKARELQQIGEIFANKELSSLLLGETGQFLLEQHLKPAAQVLENLARLELTCSSESVLLFLTEAGLLREKDGLVICRFNKKQIGQLQDLLGFQKQFNRLTTMAQQVKKHGELKAKLEQLPCHGMSEVEQQLKADLQHELLSLCGDVAQFQKELEILGIL